jgi:hypothetical protein
VLSGWEGLRELADRKPEFLVYAGHGHRAGAEEPTLAFTGSDRRPTVLTTYDVAMRIRLPRNRMTVIGACLAGQGAPLGGGDVGGFLRAFMAAGAGVMGIPLWSILDDRTVSTVSTLLRASRGAADRGAFYNAPAVLRRHYEQVHTRLRSGRSEPDTYADSFPMALYL